MVSPSVLRVHRLSIRHLLVAIAVPSSLTITSSPRIHIVIIIMMSRRSLSCAVHTTMASNVVVNT